MPLQIFLDASSAEETLTRMQLNIREFGHSDIRDELISWQVEDMHRHFPNVDTDQEYVSWFTLIWPRSRSYLKTSQQYVGKGVYRRHRRPLSPRPRLIGGKGKGSTRPILRPALFNRLVLRMSDLLGTSLTWTRAKSGGPPIGPGGPGGPGGPADGAARIAALGPRSARRIAAVQASQVQATRVSTPYQPGPRTRARWAKLPTQAPTKVAARSQPGLRTMARWSKLPKAGTPAPAKPASALGPRTRTRLMKLGLLPPNG